MLEIYKSTDEPKHLIYSFKNKHDQIFRLYQTSCKNYITIIETLDDVDEVAYISTKKFTNYDEAFKYSNELRNFHIWGFFVLQFDYSKPLILQKPKSSYTNP